MTASREAERSTRPTHACVGENTLTAFVEGALLGEGLSKVADHLASCSACGAVVEHAMLSRASRPRRGAPTSEGAVSSALLSGSRVGRYQVLEAVGSGAMGTVYAAHDPDLDRRVALKLLRSNAGGDQLRARLSREAKAMARLSHPNVITVHDVGAHGAQLFVTMEFVAGGTLRAWIAQRPRAWAEVLNVFVRAGRGLACAHAAGLVHRDFKPDNVLVGDDGRVRVTDFGLARALRDERPEAGGDVGSAHDVLETTITRTGALVGTPAYMAPEQLRGEPADARADTFSFSVALYEALYGERPYGGATVTSLRSETASGVVRSPPPGAEVPLRVREVLLEGLRPRAEDRPASLEVLLDALEAAIPTPAESPALTVEAPRRDTLAATLRPIDAPPRRRTQRPLWAVVTAGAAVVAVLALRTQWRAPNPEVQGEERAQPRPTESALPAFAPVDVTPPPPPSPVSARPAEASVVAPKPRLPATAVRTAQPAVVVDAGNPATVPAPPPAPSASIRSAPLGGDATNDRE